jgi:hypothetical protein
MDDNAVIFTFSAMLVVIFAFWLGTAVKDTPAGYVVLPGNTYCERIGYVKPTEASKEK